MDAAVSLEWHLNAAVSSPHVPLWKQAPQPRWLVAMFADVCRACWAVLLLKYTQADAVGRPPAAAAGTQCNGRLRSCSARRKLRIGRGPGDCCARRANRAAQQPVVRAVGAAGRPRPRVRVRCADIALLNLRGKSAMACRSRTQMVVQTCQWLSPWQVPGQSGQPEAEFPAGDRHSDASGAAI